MCKVLNPNHHRKEIAKNEHQRVSERGPRKRRRSWVVGKPPTLPEALCLIHAELSEALEEYREGNPLIYGTCALAAEDCKFSGVCDRVGRPGEGEGIDGPCKPEGIAVELADVILRTLDLMAALGVDVDAVVMAKHKYNLGREYRHGGKTV